MAHGEGEDAAMKKAYRIKKNIEIDAVIANRSTKSNKYFKLYIKANTYDHIRVAIGVSKKYGKAVERNRIKRRVRMIVSTMPMNQSVDCFVMVHTRAKTASFETLNQALVELFDNHPMTKVE